MKNISFIFFKLLSSVFYAEVTENTFQSLLTCSSSVTFNFIMLNKNDVLKKDKFIPTLITDVLFVSLLITKRF